MSGGVVQLGHVIDLLDQLVAIPTRPGQCNTQFVDFVTAHMIGAGVDVRRVRSPLGNEDGLILSAGPNRPGGLVLSGHMDVVAVDGQAWTGDPFSLRRDRGRLIGRGACDMKGFVACALSVLRAVSEKDVNTPVYVLISSDEESTCRSVETLVAALGADYPAPRGVIVGEPTGMQPADRHKLSATQQVTLSGRATHASMAHKGVNAISLAGQVIDWIDREAAAARLRGGKGEFDPDFSLHSVTRISGGIAVNTVPETCTLDWDMRLMPTEAMEEVTERFDRFADTLRVDGARVSRVCTGHFPGLRPTPSGRFGAELREASASATFLAMPFGTEAGHFQGAGLETYVCGPGDIAQAHVADEFVHEAQLQACLDLLERVAGAPA